MTTDSRFTLSNEDQEHIRVFVALLNEPGIQAILIEHARETRLGAANPGETISMHIKDVVNTDPSIMYRAGFSFAELAKLAWETKEKKDIPSDLLPSPILSDNIRFLYWEYFRETNNKPKRR